jgi:hypothetical protein
MDERMMDDGGSLRSGTDRELKLVVTSFLSPIKLWGCTLLFIDRDLSCNKALLVVVTSYI